MVILFVIGFSKLKEIKEYKIVKMLGLGFAGEIRFIECVLRINK